MLGICGMPMYVKIIGCHTYSSKETTMPSFKCNRNKKIVYNKIIVLEVIVKQVHVLKPPGMSPLQLGYGR